MDHLDNFRIKKDDRGVLTAALDVRDRPVNVLDAAVFRDLTTLLDELERDQTVRLVVFRSGKASGFLAGADIQPLQHSTGREQIEQVVRTGQELFDRVAALPMPTVAAIHGPCLGGGLEFALACRFRVARDDASTRIGLPETQLGLIPGWGGTQRLPLLVGLAPALRMILEGSRLPAAKALKLGLVDLATPPDRFEEELQAFVANRLAGTSILSPRRGLMAWLRDHTLLGRRVVLRVARKQIGRSARHYPALPAAIEAVETGLRHGHERGLAAEREHFCRVVRTPTCRNLLELFFQRERARRLRTWIADEQISPRAVQTVAVIGAGTMGAGIAQLAAVQGCDVVLKDISQELVDAGLGRIDSLFQEAVRKGALSSEESAERMRSITATTQWEPVARADLAVEAVVERMDVKQQVFRELDQRLRPEALIVSNTSALPVSEMAGATGRASQAAGLHFFNPVHRMPLVEVVPCSGTSAHTVATLVEFVRKLGKAPLVVAESPGFLVNRILFPYLDEAVRLVSEGVTVEEVDRDARRFGMPMGPLELIDSVGIDVALDVSRSLSPLSSQDSPTPQQLQALVADGRLGRKSGAGFYAYRKGRKHGPAGNPESVASGHSPALPEAARFGEDEQLSGIGQRLMFAMLNEAARCLAEGVVRDAWMLDLGLVLGTGFAPFRGGPLRLIDAWGVPDVVATLEQLAETCGPRFTPCDALVEMRAENRAFYGEHSAPGMARMSGSPSQRTCV